jgi:hypothetical protein
VNIKGKIERIIPVRRQCLLPKSGAMGLQVDPEFATVRVLITDGPKSMVGKAIDMNISVRELAQHLPMEFLRRLQEEIQDLLPTPVKLGPSHFPT